MKIFLSNANQVPSENLLFVSVVHRCTTLMHDANKQAADDGDAKTTKPLPTYNDNNQLTNQKASSSRPSPYIISLSLSLSLSLTCIIMSNSTSSSSNTNHTHTSGFPVPSNKDKSSSFDAAVPNSTVPSLTPSSSNPSVAPPTTSSNNTYLTHEERLGKTWRNLASATVGCFSKAEKASQETTREHIKELDDSVLTFIRFRMEWIRLLSHVQAKLQGKQQEMEALECYIRTQPRLGRKRKRLATPDDEPNLDTDDATMLIDDAKGFLEDDPAAVGTAQTGAMAALGMPMSSTSSQQQQQQQQARAELLPSESLLPL